jgi:transcriptional regulator with XRE-family HTH domain
MQTQKLLGHRIRSLRQGKGLTQQQLGERAHLNYKYLGLWNVVRRTLHSWSFERIATALAVELLDLFHFAHEETGPRALRKLVNGLLTGADTAELQLACKLLRALLR